MQLPLSENQGLVKFRIRTVDESRIFFMKRRESQGHFLFLSLGFQFKGTAQIRGRKIDPGKLQFGFRIGQRITGMGILEFDKGGKVPRLNRFDLGSFLSIHLENLSDPFLMIPAGVDEVHPGFHFAAVESKE